MSTLTGSIVTKSSLNSLLGFDTASVVSASNASNFYNDGYSFCIRYVSLGSTEASGDLTYTEATNILNSGLALMVVQHVRNSGWNPNGTLGTQDGTNAANNCKNLGLPSGVTVWCDLEGVSGSVSSQDIINYCNNWYAQVSKAGYVPGLYVGANCGLTSSQLYYSLSFTHYWKSGSVVPGVDNRGYQMVQFALDTPLHGISIDKDTIGQDQFEDTPTLLKK